MAFPLSSVSTKQLQNLCQCLWDWELCGGSDGNPECIQPTCSWSRAKLLQKFWSRYIDLTGAYAPEFFAGQPALSSHEDLLKILQVIRNQPDLKREEVIERCFPAQGENANGRSYISDRNRAINIAASILFLTNCGTVYDCADALDDEGSSIPWRDRITASAFVSEAYPIKSHPYFNHLSDEYKPEEVLQAVLATKLIKAGLTLEPTNDLRSHLTVTFSKGRRVIKVFDCITVLKEMLLASQNDSSSPILPRLLALEVLGTIHHILFPMDSKSQVLLSSLVQKHQFDENLLQYDLARYSRDDDSDIAHSYFGVRLAQIYDEVQHPTPRPGLESWFHKYSAQRYMIMATAIGVFIAVVLGFLGLIVSGFQAWVSYQQWKHPVKND